MAFPLIPLLMLGAGIGSEYAGAQRRREAQERRGNQLDALFGQPQQPGFQAPGPDPSFIQELQTGQGAQGLINAAQTQPGAPQAGGPGFPVAPQGFGLLSDPTDFANQVQFATGLMRVPGYEQMGGSMLGSMLNAQQQRAQQQAQFEQNFGLRQQAEQRSQAKQDADLAQAQIDAAQEERQRILGEEQRIRGEYTQAIAPYAEQQRAFRAAMSGLQGGTGFDAVANVVNFMKTLDPRSVVTDREGNQVISAQGMFGSIAQTVNNALRGEGFDDTARRQIAQTLLRQIMPMWETANKQRAFFEQMAASQGLGGGRIFGGQGVDFSQPAIPESLLNLASGGGDNAPGTIPAADAPSDLGPPPGNPVDVTAPRRFNSFLF